MPDLRSSTPAEPETDWPIASMLLCGTFGRAAGPAARRLNRASWIALGIFVGGSLLGIQGSRALGINLDRWMLAPLYAAVFGILTTNLWRYINALDEMARRIQLEAMTITYLIGMLSFMVLGGVEFATSWHLHPWWFIALEPIRGVVLVLLARRYR